ncbi:MAG: DUF2127 domain-containing protein [Verrucomicrobiota bacterium]|jgi:uncharacterized membrane protein (DUF2068 family)
MPPDTMLIKKPLLTGVRTVALFEAAKGAVVLLAGLGLLALVHHDLQAMAESLVRHSHLNPGSHYPRIFIEAAAHTTDGRLRWLAAGAAAYALVRAIEAYGLWRERRWAEWFALVAGALYLPVEIYEIIHHATWLNATVLVTNAAIVASMAYALRHAKEQERERRGAGD